MPLNDTRFIDLITRFWNVQECDATEDEKCYVAGIIIIKPKNVNGITKQRRI